MFVKNEFIASTFILIADFQNNHIAMIDFLQARIFGNLVFLDFSRNHISLINFGVHFFLRQLAVLVLKRNPIREIILETFDFMSNLLLIDIRYIAHGSQLSVSFPSNLSKPFGLKVSESIICCISIQIKCIHTMVQSLCFGIVKGNIIQTCFTLHPLWD